MTAIEPLADDDVPVRSDDAGSHHLTGNLNTFQLLFTVLAFNGPLAVVVGFAAVIIGYGNWLGAPMAYVASAAVVALFAVGFTKMAKEVDNPGGFYSFVARGLGREAGLGASFLALICYYLLLLGCYAFAGIALQAMVTSLLNGPNLDWWVWALITQVVCGVLGYFRLDLSAKILTLLLGLEIAIVVVYDAAVVGQEGASGLSADSLLPSNIFSGGVGLALLFGMLCMGGFEVTAVFRDEVRDPEKTVPRATYLFIATVAVMYGVTTWVIIQGLGSDNAVATAAADPTGAFYATMKTFVGDIGLDIVTVLLCSSVFAATLATHNVLARYLFNLSVDGIFPEQLSTVHHQHGSPHRASVVTSALVLAGFVTVVLSDPDPAVLYAQLTGGFGYALIMLLLLTSVAILAFMHRNRLEGTTVWHRVVAPAVATALLVVTLYLATTNIDLLITAGDTVVNSMLAVLYLSVVVGGVVAMILKRRKPAVYARIGRQ